MFYVVSVQQFTDKSKQNVLVRNENLTFSHFSECEVISYIDLRTYGWESAIKCEFNPEALMLMVSGCLDHRLATAVLWLEYRHDRKSKRRNHWQETKNLCENFQSSICCLISSEFKWLANLISTIMLSVNKVSWYFVRTFTYRKSKNWFYGIFISLQLFVYNRPCHVWCPPRGKAPYPNENKNKTKFFSSG